MKNRQHFSLFSVSSILLAVVFATVAAAQPASSGSDSNIRGLNSPDRIPGEYIVVLKEAPIEDYMAAFPGTDRVELIGSLTEEVMSSREGRANMLYAFALNGFSLKGAGEATARAIARHPLVEYVVVNQRATLYNHNGGFQSSPPSWGLDRIDERYLPLDGGFRYRNAGQGVHVYVIDTGINPHWSFGNRLHPGVDVSPEPPPCQGCGDPPCPGCVPPSISSLEDCTGHGTHVAGTIGSSKYGVAKEVELYSVRVFNCEAENTVEAIIAGIDWVANNHTDPAVVNMSLGSPKNSALDDAAVNLMDLGIPVVVAAGNSNSDACTDSPGGAPGVITVAASKKNDERASFSSWGTCVELFAPGKNIVSISSGGSVGCATGTCSGTSMAAPHVTAVAAQFKSEEPMLSPDTVSLWLSFIATDNVISNSGPGTPNKLLHVWEYHD